VIAWVAYRTWVAGDTLTAAQLNQDVRDNGNIIAAVGITGWTAYTATWSASGTAVSLGNGSSAGKYAQLGKLVVARFTLNPGNTTTYGTGDYSWALPVTSATISEPSPTFGGSMRAIDSGTARYQSEPMYATTTTVQAETSTAFWGQTVPMTWVDADSMYGMLFYEAA
jgi:hypothetical protein